MRLFFLLLFSILLFCLLFSSSSSFFFFFYFFLIAQGNGKWGGLGGILKGYLERVNIRFLSWELKMNDEPEKNPVNCDGGRVLNVEHVAQQFAHRFGTEEWRQSAKGAERPVSRFEIYYRDTDAIKRPKNEVKYDRIDGISKSYQYIMLKSGAVLARRHSCWCTRCLQVAISGPAATLSNYRVDGCERAVADPALYEYANHSCAVANGAGVRELDERAS